MDTSKVPEELLKYDLPEDIVCPEHIYFMVSWLEFAAHKDYPGTSYFGYGMTRVGFLAFFEVYDTMDMDKPPMMLPKSVVFDLIMN